MSPKIVLIKTIYLYYIYYKGYIL